jgi:hypothetical protein
MTDTFRIFIYIINDVYSLIVCKGTSFFSIMKGIWGESSIEGLNYVLYGLKIMLAIGAMPHLPC